MSFFKATKKCEFCSKTSDFAQIVKFDPTSRGANKTSEKPKYVCIEHLKVIWTENASMHPGVAVCFLPFTGWNSYSFGAIDEIKDWGITPGLVQSLDNMLNTDFLGRNCQVCSKSARTIFYKYTIDDALRSDIKTLLKEFYCWEHFISTVCEMINKPEYKLDEINAPYVDKGVYMQGEY